MTKRTDNPTTGELRAFEAFDHVPPGCKLELVRDGSHTPHLRPGEFVVADLNDRTLVSGELYLIRYPNGGRAIRQVLMRRHHDADRTFDGIWFCSLCRPTYRPDGEIDWSRPFHLIDGPLNPAYLDQYLLGRVIGIFQAPEIAGADALPRPDLNRWIEE